MKLRLGTRGSALALARSEVVAEQLRAAGNEVEIVRVATSGVDSNHMPDGYSVVAFAKELREALRSGDCDVVVHSIKDIPLTDEPEGLTFPAVLARGDHRDALVTLKGVALAALPRIPAAALSNPQARWSGHVLPAWHGGRPGWAPSSSATNCIGTRPRSTSSTAPGLCLDRRMASSSSGL